jgi:hypothetical protein
LLVAAILDTGAEVNLSKLTAFKDLSVLVDFVDLDSVLDELEVVHIKIINANGIQEGTYRQATLRTALICVSDF